MTSIHVSTETLTISLTRVEKFFGLLRDLTVPLDGIVAVEVVPDGLVATRGLRAPGLALPGLRQIGTWRGKERLYVSVRGGRPALRLRLTGQKYDGAVVTVADPEGTLARIREVAPHVG